MNRVKNKYEIVRDIKDSIWFRTIMYPYGAYKFNKFNRTFDKSPYPDKIKAFKNIHYGERCFVIGNGPSLTPNDLNLICREKSFAANKIYNIFPYTKWRPNYYLCMDYMSIVEEISFEADKFEADTIFINWQQNKRINNLDNCIYCNFNPRYVINFWDDKKIMFSEDCSKFIDNARTVTYSSLQLAVYMGFTEIYLLGIDFCYPFYKDGKGKKHMAKVTDSHFKNGGYNRIDYMVKETNAFGLKKAKEYCDNHGIIIRNATRGGELEIFPRVKLNDII